MRTKVFKSITMSKIYFYEVSIKTEYYSKINT